MIHRPVTTFVNTVALLGTLVLFAPEVRADNPVERALKTFTANDVQGYIQPLQDLFGANMTSGWYGTAYVPKQGFSLSVKIVGMGALIDDDAKSYNARTPAGFTQQEFRTATVFGKEGTLVTDPSGLSYRGTDGALDNLPILPLAALQATLGHIQGTEIIVRGIPLPEISGLPKITFWGVGGRHSIDQYFGNQEPPVYVAFGIFYNKISMGDFVDITSLSIGAQGSKRFSILELYGGLAYTKNTMRLRFNSSQPGNPAVDVELEGTDKFRGTLGLTLHLGILHLQSDINFGKVKSISAAIGFGF